jgi:hypothetical protein
MEDNPKSSRSPTPQTKWFGEFSFSSSGLLIFESRVERNKSSTA